MSVPDSSSAHATHRLTIDALAYGPYGVGRVHGRVVFVPLSAPGDEGEVILAEERKGYAVGKLVTLQKPSTVRRAPPCPYVPRCGGCPWQHIEYAAQLEAKQHLLRQHLQRIAGISDPALRPIIASPQQWGYRSRLRLRVDDEKRLGFYRARSHELVEVSACLIAQDCVSASLGEARRWLASLSTRVRRLEIVSCSASGRVVLVGNAEGPFRAADERASEGFLRASSGVAGLALFGRGWRRSWGETRVRRDLGVDDLCVHASAGSFTQVNPAANRTLIGALLDLGRFRPDERVLELYCGAGNLSLPVARRVRELVGVDDSALGIEDARTNALDLGIGNCRFLCSPAKKQVRRLAAGGERFDAVLLDPPRAGAAEVVADIRRLSATKVVYVSCHPATLARDVRELCRRGYALSSVQPIDLFPHTYHLEVIAALLLT